LCGFCVTTSGDTTKDCTPDIKVCVEELKIHKSTFLKISGKNRQLQNAVRDEKDAHAANVEQIKSKLRSCDELLSAKSDSLRQCEIYSETDNAKAEISSAELVKTKRTLQNVVDANDELSKNKDNVNLMKKVLGCIFALMFVFVDKLLEINLSKNIFCKINRDNEMVFYVFYVIYTGCFFILDFILGVFLSYIVIAVIMMALNVRYKIQNVLGINILKLMFLKFTDTKDGDDYTKAVNIVHALHRRYTLVALMFCIWIFLWGSHTNWRLQLVLVIKLQLTYAPIRVWKMEHKELLEWFHTRKSWLWSGRLCLLVCYLPDITWADLSSFLHVFDQVPVRLIDHVPVRLIDQVPVRLKYIFLIMCELSYHNEEQLYTIISMLWWLVSDVLWPKFFWLLSCVWDLLCRINSFVWWVWSQIRRMPPFLCFFVVFFCLFCFFIYRGMLQMAEQPAK